MELLKSKVSFFAKSSVVRLSVMDVAKGKTVTRQTALVPLSSVQAIFAVPGFLAVTKPPLRVTSATAGLSEV